ncbi:DNA polymerase III subunit beta [Notoacmeibacter sp. MSK16QG-6]|uniref:DNA polymerase III subunit beta n=1 Tax=Notoacmeibacter sp. MSK16QG-6 TaxID=2957982 RepID=UPI0020A02E5D|nr:DNA polymerase III subunit beta [Notoacmeibacter sp. MSK16QG-6]MCP1200092.1 DNA polymerase III subunit beta [Notoacmeibacter sp. MSK16QG-6]
MASFSVTIESPAILRPVLDRAQKIVEKRNTIPILGHFHLTGGADGITVRATDLDRDIAITIQDGVTVTAPGAIAVPAADLANIVRKLPNGAEICFEADERSCAIVAGRSKFSLPILPAGDFPTMEDIEGEGFAVPAEALTRIADAVTYAISTEETRYYLNGVYWHAGDRDGEITAVATDGHRLSRIVLAVPDKPADMPGVIIPSATVALFAMVAGLDETPRMTVTTTRIRFETPGMVLQSRLIDGTYPDYGRVIPQPSGHAAMIDRQSLADAIDRIRVVQGDRGAAIKFQFDDENDLTMIAADRERDAHGNETLPVDRTPDNAALPVVEIGFNGKYMLDCLNSIDSEVVQLDIADSSAPVRVEDPDDPTRIAILMPMRV